MFCRERKMKKQIKEWKTEKEERSKGMENSISHEIANWELQVQDMQKSSLSELIRKLQTGSVKATDALLAYQAKAIEVNKKTNCVACWIVGAFEQVEMLDKKSK